MSLRSALVFAAISVAACAALVLGVEGCALKNPVPCDPSRQWPDPCADGVVEIVAKDASADR